MCTCVHKCALCWVCEHVYMHIYISKKDVKQRHYLRREREKGMRSGVVWGPEMYHAGLPPGLGSGLLLFCSICNRYGKC